MLRTKDGVGSHEAANHGNKPVGRKPAFVRYAEQPRWAVNRVMRSRARTRL